MKKLAIILIALTLLVVGMAMAEGNGEGAVNYWDYVIAGAIAMLFALAGFFKNADQEKPDPVKICVNGIAGFIFGMYLIYVGQEPTPTNVILWIGAVGGYLQFGEDIVKGILRRFFNYYPKIF